jgi:hypothetical protein
MREKTLAELNIKFHEILTNFLELLHKETVRETLAGAFMQPFWKRVKNNFSNTRIVLHNITNHTAYGSDMKKYYLLGCSAVKSANFYQNTRRHILF